MWFLVLKLPVATSAGHWQVRFLREEFASLQQLLAPSWDGRAANSL
eukprot:CAMPEP_0194497886 /NCGR_PEP_ID=MMETSP0253-20130528/14694_1 /TAXON_ID=2966 /ORGANISM="Noctiluca scintillans" /LENGTH=45 /DNA_ID= /DNA_START= /DNA_END= /DNA_ORIENTATION=